MRLLTVYWFLLYVNGDCDVGGIVERTRNLSASLSADCFGSTTVGEGTRCVLAKPEYNCDTVACSGGVWVPSIDVASDPAQLPACTASTQRVSVLLKWLTTPQLNADRYIELRAYLQQLFSPTVTYVGTVDIIQGNNEVRVQLDSTGYYTPHSFTTFVLATMNGENTNPSSLFVTKWEGASVISAAYVAPDFTPMPPVVPETEDGDIPWGVVAGIVGGSVCVVLAWLGFCLWRRGAVEGKVAREREREQREAMLGEGEGAGLGDTPSAAATVPATPSPVLRFAPECILKGEALPPTLNPTMSQQALPPMEGEPNGYSEVV